MLTLMLGALAFAGGDGSEKWKDGELDPKVLHDVTAYTAGKNVWTLGVGTQDFGLLTNMSIGTRAAFYVLGVANAHAKITAIQTPKFDVAFQAEWLRRGFGEDIVVTATPIGWTGSWIVSRRLSLHGGTSWMLMSAKGTLGVDEIASGLAGVIGVDVSADLSEQLSTTEVYAGVNASVYQTRIAADYRLNRRDSIVFTLQNYVALSGLVAGGVGYTTPDGIELQAGPSARFAVPLDDALPVAMTLSWQFSWDRAHLRLGIPLTKGISVIYAMPEALALYWDLGPKKKADADP